MSLLDQLRQWVSQVFFCGAECQEDLRQVDLMVSSVLLVGSLLVSLYHAHRHITNYSNPFFQDKIVVILFMSPFYSICSYLGIAYPIYTEYINLIRDIYEAFLLFTFFYLIFAYLAYDPQQDLVVDVKVYSILVQQIPNEVCHVFPIGLFSKPYKLNDLSKAKYFVYRCKRFILQFLVIKPLSSLLLIVCNLFEHEPAARFLIWAVGWVVCISISLSLYYLVLFYNALKKPLSRYNPLLKFLTIKITLFFTFWQSILLRSFRQDILHNFDHQAPLFDEDAIMGMIENTLVCIEMFVMAVAAGYAYTYKDFLSSSARKGSLLQILRNNWHSFLLDFRLIKPKKFGFRTAGPVQNDFEGHDRERFSSYVKKQFDIELAEVPEQGVQLKAKLIDTYL